MKAYLAIVFAKHAAENQSYLAEVAAAIKSVAGNNLKRGENAASLTTIAFLTDKDDEFIRKIFLDLWRPENRTWVVPMDEPVLADKSIMDWIRKARAKA